MIQDATMYRSKEQVLYDLSQALHFSPDSLEANRKGQISQEQIKKFAIRCVSPASLTFAFALAPFLLWISALSSGQQISFGAALPVLTHELTHVKDLFENHGKKGGVIMLGSIVISLGIAAFMAMRVPLALYFDLLDRKVKTQEGRVVAREEQINRPNGRDPIESTFSPCDS